MKYKRISIRARERIREKIVYNNPKMSSQLTGEQRDFLKKLNQTLMGLETKLSKEACQLNQTAKQRVADAQDWIEDYEIECLLAFILNESDPKFDKDEDNILTELFVSLKGKPLWEWDDEELSFFGTDILNWNWNEYKNSHHPMKDESHCYLYHQLYYSELEWDKILRVGSIWIDINVIYQSYIQPHMLELD